MSVEERKLWSLACQFDLARPHDCTGTIEVWNQMRLVRTEPCPCSCHPREA